MSAQVPLRLTSKIGSEEKLSGQFSAVCPVSLAIRLASWLPRPGNGIFGTARRSAAATHRPLELLKCPVVRLTGQDRMGITGARWGLQGAQAILWLRAIAASGDHDAYWDYHIAQEHQRNHLSRYQDGLDLAA